MDKIKQLFQTKNSRRGSYSIAVTAVVIGIVILFNLLVAQLPQKIRQIDISDTNIYEISSTSQKLLKNLDKDVSLYVIAEKGNTDDRIRTFITKYASLSSRLRVEWIDPVLHPSALTKYDTEKNSIVVSCKATDRQTSISFDDILVTESSYYNTSSSATKFDGDGQLTSAVDYVTNTKEYKAYYTSGHGETALSSSVTDLMEKSRISVSELNLLTASSIRLCRHREETDTGNLYAGCRSHRIGHCKRQRRKEEKERQPSDRLRKQYAHRRTGNRVFFNFRKPYAVHEFCHSESGQYR